MRARRWRRSTGVVAFFEEAMVEDTLVLPYAKQGLIGEVYGSARVLRRITTRRVAC